MRARRIGTACCGSCLLTAVSLVGAAIGRRWGRRGWLLGPASALVALGMALRELHAQRSRPRPGEAEPDQAVLVDLDVVAALRLDPPPPDREEPPFWLLALDDDHLLVVRSYALEYVPEFPHPRMCWVIGPRGLLLDYQPEGRPIAAAAETVSDEEAAEWDLLVEHNGRVLPGTLDHWRQALRGHTADAPEVPLPGYGASLP